jgi:hypothetical protein
MCEQWEHTQLLARILQVLACKVWKVRTPRLHSKVVTNYNLNCKVKVKSKVEQATKAQTGSTGTAPLFP